MSTFQIYKGNDAGAECWRWRLIDDNGQNIAHSEEAFLQSSIRRSIETIQDHAPGASIVERDSAEDNGREYRFRYFQGKDDQWYWHLVAPNQEKLGHGEGYVNKSGVKRALENIRTEMGRADVVSI